MSLDPAVAAVRLAVRRCIPAPGEVVLVACSGGADSLALLAATVFEARKDAVRVIGAVVDHGLQAGSADHTAGVVAQMQALGVDETATIRVTVDPGPAGIEAGAREARYAALGQLAEHFGARVVLLGHTLDDQAETVLLGLVRGSGGRSLQGMRPELDLDGVPVSRPLLDLTRAQTEAACLAEGISWWEDPQNAEARFLRSRVRHTVMPLLETELGPGVREALARTAEQLRADTAELDALAGAAFASARLADGLDLSLVDSTGRAIVTRVLRLAAIEAGAIAEELTYRQVVAVLEVGPGKEIQLPGHVTAYRSGDQVLFRPTITP
jgi:tRNA(Ile)-lysidine synthase